MNTFDPLKALQGEPFWLELCASTLQMLCTAAQLDAADLAVLIGKSESLASQLLAGEAGFANGVCERLGQHFNIIPLRPLTPSPAPLCQLTPRSLALLQKGRKFSRTGLARASGLSLEYLKLIEAGSRQSPSAPKLRALSKPLGVQLFII